MKYCKFCCSEIDKKAKICPICRKRQKQFRISAVIIGVLVVIFLCVVYVVNSDVINELFYTESSPAVKIISDYDDYDSLLLKPDHYGKSDNLGLYYIYGTVHNSSSKDYSYAQITFKTYDSNGNVIGNCYDNVNGPGGYENWEFEAICDKTADEISSYKLADITGW